MDHRNEGALSKRNEEGPANKMVASITVSVYRNRLIYRLVEETLHLYVCVFFLYVFKGHIPYVTFNSDPFNVQK